MEHYFEKANFGRQDVRRPHSQDGVLLSGRDFNFFEHVFLDCSDLFQAD